ncbi:hypothetical protein H5410_062130 [Solanum commersonii]|uniref:Uncharacterized protein n=1 Tax=Solanum commersonii TaxID=4109 RepID=A0A9J5WAQ8_SOLCO|nr:hypothetical protein H5410_062130 [Solanum commersonii]
MGVGVVPSSLDHVICAPPMDVHRTIVVASSQGVVSSSPNHGIFTSPANVDRTVTCDSQMDACKDVSYMDSVSFPLLWIVAFAPLIWMSTDCCCSILSRYIFRNLNGIMTEVIRVNDKSPIGVVSSSSDHGVCAYHANIDRTVVASSSQDTSSPLDDHTCDSQVDSCKDSSPMGVGVVVVPSSLDRVICTPPMDVHRTIGISTSPTNVDKTVVAASSQDISSTIHAIGFPLKDNHKHGSSSPLDDQTCDSQMDACKDVSPMGSVSFPLLWIMAFAPLLWMSTYCFCYLLSRYIFHNLNCIMTEVIRVNDKSPISVVSSSPDHGTCASPADGHKTDVVASSQGTYPQFMPLISLIWITCKRGS